MYLAVNVLPHITGAIRALDRATARAMGVGFVVAKPYSWVKDYAVIVRKAPTHRFSKAQAVVRAWFSIAAHRALGETGLVDGLPPVAAKVRDIMKTIFEKYVKENISAWLKLHYKIPPSLVRRTARTAADYMLYIEVAGLKDIVFSGLKAAGLSEDDIKKAIEELKAGVSAYADRMASMKRRFIRLAKYGLEPGKLVSELLAAK